MSEVYRPYGAAEEVFYAREREVCLSGPAGTGKSRACLGKVDLCARKYAGMRALICRRTRVSLTQSGLVTFEERVLPVGSRIAEGVTREGRKSYRYPNGSEIVVGGLDRPGRVMSTEYDLIYIQEAIEAYVDAVEALLTRLRNGKMPYQQMISDTNPDAPSHWLYQRAQAGLCRMLESRHEDNPILWDRELGDWTERGRAYIATLDALTGARYARLRKGLWVQAEGQVYESWDPAVHVVPRSALPRDFKRWRRVRAIDFGFTNPFCCLWGAVDPDGRLWIYRQIYRTRRIVADHAKGILRLSVGEDVEATVCDHDAEDRATLEAALIPTKTAFKNIRQGIEAVEERLKAAGDGKPRLFFVEGSLVEADPLLFSEGAAVAKPYSSEQEFSAYVWPVGKDGKPAKELPVDDNNHGMDTLRYLVAYVDGLGRKVIRPV